jgi:hypothetical protein
MVQTFPDQLGRNQKTRSRHPKNPFELPHKVVQQDVRISHVICLLFQTHFL